VFFSHRGTCPQAGDQLATPGGRLGGHRFPLPRHNVHLRRRITHALDQTQRVHKLSNFVWVFAVAILEFVTSIKKNCKNIPILQTEIYFPSNTFGRCHIPRTPTRIMGACPKNHPHLRPLTAGQATATLALSFGFFLWAAARDRPS